ncbi:MAG: hypothetical protein WCR46_14420 [Deltaproteobacteria bacterium]
MTGAGAYLSACPLTPVLCRLSSVVISGQVLGLAATSVFASAGDEGWPSSKNLAILSGVL